MVSRLPMVCDSCLHKLPGQFACDAFPDGIELNPYEAELHDEPLPDQDNDIVWTLASGQQWMRDAFDAYRDVREARLAREGKADEPAPDESASDEPEQDGSDAWSELVEPDKPGT